MFEEFKWIKHVVTLKIVQRGRLRRNKINIHKFRKKQRVFIGRTTRPKSYTHKKAATFLSTTLHIQDAALLKLFLSYEYAGLNLGRRKAKMKKIQILMEGKYRLLFQRRLSYLGHWPQREPLIEIRSFSVRVIRSCPLTSLE